MIKKRQGTQIKCISSNFLSTTNVLKIQFIWIDSPKKRMIYQKDLEFLIILSNCMLITDYKQMKQRLDLETLLRKYQNNQLLSNDAQTYQQPYTKYTFKSKLNKVKTQANFYTHQHYYNTKVMRSPQRNDQYLTRKNQNFVNLNFQMSKSQCEYLLLSMKQEFKNQERSIEGYILSNVEQSIDRFQRTHQELRMQLLNLIEQSLDISRKTVLDYLNKLKTQSSSEYSSVYKKIGTIDGELSRLLAGLNGNDYKKTIAEVVTKDYFQLLKSFRSDITSCNNSYRNNMTIPVLDKAKIKHIQETLHNLYQINQQKKYFEDRNIQKLDLQKLSRRSSKKKIFQSRNDNKFAMTEREQQKKESRQMRRTFFNFDQDY